MSYKRPDVARGWRPMKTETDKEIVAANEARRRIKLRAMKKVRVKMRIKEKYDEKREGTKGRKKKRCTNVKRCKKVKRAHTGNSMNTSAGIQNRVTIWRTLDSERDTIEESTIAC